MPEKDPNLKKYDHHEAIKQQIRHVNNLISDIRDDEGHGFETYYNKVFMGLSSLNAMIDPYKDEEYMDYIEDKDALALSRRKKLEFVYNSFKEMMNLMHRKDLFYASRSGRQKV